MSYVLTPPVTSPVIDQSDADDAASTVSLDSCRESIHPNVDSKLGHVLLYDR